MLVALQVLEGRRCEAEGADVRVRAFIRRERRDQMGGVRYGWMLKGQPTGGLGSLYGV